MFFQTHCLIWVRLLDYYRQSLLVFHTCEMIMTSVWEYHLWCDPVMHSDTGYATASGFVGVNNTDVNNCTNNGVK